MTLDVRSFTSEFELRKSGDGRTLVGRVVPFGEIYEAGMFRERFVRGAFTRTIAERGPSRVKLTRQHDDTHSFPIGVATLLVERASELYGEFRLAKTAPGDEALELVRDGILDGLSVGFVPIKSKTVSGVVEQHEVSLRHVGLVSEPAYETARVTALRNAEPYDPRLDPELLRAQLVLAQL
jgi:HK97 family phage prohead protease